MHSIDWGSVPAWLAGAGAIVALVFARAAAGSSRDTNRAQQEQMESLRRDEGRREAEARRHQAASVAIWVTTLKEEKPSGSDRTLDGLRVGVNIGNMSDLPIYQLLLVGHVKGQTFTDRYTVIGPRTPRRNLGRLSRDIDAAVIADEPVHLLTENLIMASCSFRDAAGTWWARDTSGLLHEVKTQETAERLALTTIAPRAIGGSPGVAGLDAATDVL